MFNKWLRLKIKRVFPALTGCSLKHFENDVAYISGWLKKLKDDRRFILFASSKVQRAVDYILNQLIADVKEEIGPTADVSA